MMEFGVRESWTKVATVPYLVNPWLSDSDELLLYIPLWYLTDGRQMVILVRSEFAVYNVHYETFK